MKYLKITILLALIAVSLITARHLHAATEFISVVDPGNGQGTDYTSLSAWETAIQSDLTTSTTMVFSYGVASGTIPDGVTIVGATSGAIATATHMTATTTLTGSAQILLTNIKTATFQAGEKLYIQGGSADNNYAYITDTGTSAIAVAKCRATGGLPDTTSFWVDGWTATSTNYIKIWADPNEPFRHKGVWDDDKFRLIVDVDDHALHINEDFTRIDGLQIKSSGYSGRHAIEIYFSGTTINESRISNNIIKGRNIANASGIYIVANDNSNGYIWNNIIYDYKGSGGEGINNACSGTSRYYIYNNTFYNSAICLNNAAAGTTVFAKNNITQNCTNGYDGNFITGSDNNISDIAGDAPNLKFATTAIEVIFEDEINYDLHLDSADTAAKNMGTTSVSEIGFTTDVDNETRRGNFDIGADENVAKIYRSVGPSATAAITTGTSDNHSNHLNIAYASSTATNTATYAYFEYPLPDNIGVGDAIQYDSDNNGTIDSLAFIHQRWSSQKYKVYKLDATRATTTSVADIDWSIYRAYTSLSNAEGGTENANLDDNIEQFDAAWSASGGKDLTADTANEQWNIACYANGTTADTDAVTVQSWTTSADNYLKIYTPYLPSEVGISQRHAGKWGANKYSIVLSSGAPLTINDEYVTVDGLQIYKNHTGANSGILVTTVNSANYFIIKNNIIKADAVTTNWHYGIRLDDTDISGAKIYDNIIYDININGGGFGVGIDTSGAANTYVYNNTIQNCYYGIRLNSGSTIAKNNIAKGSGNTNAYEGNFTAGTDYNSTDGTDSIGQGTHNRTSQTFIFRDEASDDFHLAPNDTGAKNYGADLSYDVYLPIKTDIDADTSCLLEPGNAYNDCGQTRPYNTAHDIGADEVITPIYRSVGPSATAAIASGSSATLSIASSSATSSATFSTAMPDNVGVGDAIQYDSDNNGTIDALAFITGRTDSTHYNVTKYDGTPATSTTAADSDWAIYRAYISLANAESGTENSNISAIVQQFDASWSGSGGKNIASSSEQWNIACYAGSISGGSSTPDTSAVTINNWTTSPVNYIKIYTPNLTTEVGSSQRHNGKWDKNKYNINFTATANYQGAVYIYQDYAYFFRVEGLQIKLNDGGYLNQSGIFAGGQIYSAKNSNVNLSQNIIIGGTQTNEANIGIYVYGHGTYTVNNNISYDFTVTNGKGIQSNIPTGYGMAYLYNNTTINCYDGISTSNYVKTVIGKNNLSADSSRYDYDGWYVDENSVNNAASDNTVSYGGSNYMINQTFTFLDEANDDFHLAQNDTAAKDAGMDLSNDPWLPIKTDIDSNNRPNSNFQNPNNKFDIGADEAATPIYRSVAPSATTVLTSGTSNTMSINATTSTATFISGLPDNIGVGDLIQYDADNNGTIDSAAFIHGRTSSTTYTVKDWAGANPVSTIANDNDWGIYRAYTSLYNAERGNENDTASDTIENFDDWIYGGTISADEGGRGIWTNNEQWNIAAYANGTIAEDKPGFNQSVMTINGWTTHSTNYLKVYTPYLTSEVGTSQRHNGKWDPSKYHIEFSQTIDDGIYGIEARVNHVRIDGLQIWPTNQGAPNYQVGAITAGRYDGDSGGYYVSNNIIRGTVTTGYLSGIFIGGGGNYPNYIYNNIVYNLFRPSSTSYGIATGPGCSGIEDKVYIYNNTVFNCNRGFVADDYRAVWKNNIAQNCVDGFYGGMYESSSNYNLSDLASDAPGSNSWNLMDVQFADEIGKDFHLAANDISARNQGADLTDDSIWQEMARDCHDPSGLAMTACDIDGHTRSTTTHSGAWDIGADEAATAIYYSVGQNTDSHETGAGTVTVSSTTQTATFSVAQTATNMGVGDVIDYDTDNKKCYIYEKVTTSIWKCQTATGTPPIAATDVTVNSISHAFASLSLGEDGAPTLLGTSDLAADNYQLNLPCYYDSGPDTTAVTVYGWTTGVPNYIKIYTPYDINTEVNLRQRHWGKWDNNRYRMEFTNSDPINVSINFIIIDGLQVKKTDTTNYYSQAIQAGGITKNDITDIKISNNIVEGVQSGTAHDNVGINSDSFDWTTNANTVNIWNNIIYGFDSANSVGIYFSNSLGSAYNNTSCNNYSGIIANNNNILRNNLSYNSITDYSYVSNSANVSNISKDASSPNSGATDCGGHSCRNQTVQFTDSANGDFHLALTDTTARNAGTSTVIASPAGAWQSDDLAYDIDGNGRSLAATSSGWDIGADEASVEFAPTVKQSGGDFSSLSSWEAANQVDLISPNTMVFSCATTSGVMPFNSSVIGTSSGATASSTVMSTTSNQILLYNITASSTGYTFESGEKVYIQGGSTTTNYCILADSGNPAIAVAKIDGAWTSADTNAVTIDGWTTGPENYVKVYTTASARHLGKWDEGKYRLEISDEFCAIWYMENYLVIDGLQIANLRSSSDMNGIAGDPDSTFTTSGNLTISNNIIKGNPSNAGIGIHLGDIGSDSVAKIYNNIIYDFGGNMLWHRGISHHCAGWDAYIYNNTVVNSYYAYYSTGDNGAILKNNIAQDCTDGFYITYGSWGAGSNYNLSDVSSDTTGGANDKDETNVTFENEANDDFHLAPTDIAALNAGTNLMFDATSSFYTDIDGTARGAAWDIGADEVPVEYVSTICENTSAGGDCANLDYTYLARWEDKVETDLTSTSTRVFGGSKTGTLNENDTVVLYRSGVSQNATGTVVATTSDQILIDNIIISGPTASEAVGPLGAPVNAQTGDIWRVDGSNYWTVSTSSIHGGNDGLGASPIAIAKIDGAWAASDTARLVINGWTTGNDNYIKVYTASAARHLGKWDYNKYRMQITPASDYEDAIYIHEDYVKIDGLQISMNLNSHNAFGITTYQISQYNSLFDFSNNIIKSDKNGTGGGIVSYIPDYGLYRIWNNIIYRWPNDCINALYMRRAYIYNNTLFDCTYGITDLNQSSIAINNIALQTSSNSFRNNFLFGYNNVSDDTSSNNYNLTNGIINQSASDHFINTATGSEDLHLLDNSSLRDTGVDLSSTSTLDFTTDIDGYTRPYNGTWDIGADEYSQAVIYRSVGPSATTAIVCGSASRQLTVASTTSTATFTAGNGLPDNIGVGDALVYNSSSSIAFISGRTASTSYSVKSASGSNPTNQTATADWCIFRAYTSLANAEAGIENTGIPSSLRNFDDWTSGGDATTDDQGRDLVVNNEQWNIACYSNGTTADTAAVTIDGWTTGENNYIKIYTPVDSSEVGTTQRHIGKPGNSNYFLSVYGFTTLDILENYTIVDGLEINGYGGDYFGSPAINIECINGVVKNNLIYNEFVTNNSFGISIGGATIGNSYIYNNIIFNVNNGIRTDTWSGMNNFVYNNTVFNASGVCYSAGNEYHIYKNNIAQKCSSINFSGGSAYIVGSGNNISSDDSAPGVNSLNYVDIKFTNELNHDFHISPEDTNATDNGTSTVGSIVTLDIDGMPIHTYDIGADDASQYFVSTVMESGGDFSSLSSWENANQVDLTATSTLVFNCATTSGIMPFNSSVTGTSSGATANVTVMSTSSSQILLYNIQASSTTGVYFTSGEKIYITGGSTAANYCILSNAGNPAIAVAKIDGTWTSADINIVDTNGWTTSANNYIRIYTSPTARHDGKWNENKYRLDVTSSDTVTLFDINTSNLNIDGLQMRLTITGEEQFYPVLILNEIYENTGQVNISNNIITADYNDSVTDRGFGIRMIFAGAGLMEENIYNNIFYNIKSTTATGIVFNNDYGNANINFKNNTIINCGYGFYDNGGEPILLAKNNIIQDSEAFSIGFIDDGSDYNISDLLNDALGSNSKNLTEVNFVDAANNDFHLTTEDTAAKNAGTNLSSDATSSFSTDIDGQNRYDASWDIGADEAPTIIYRSVGNDTRDLNTVSATTSISGTTATFSTDMPANIGVGDALQYGSPLQLAIITGRTSSTTYSVSSATGTLPVATTSASVSIYRAHQYLSYWEDQTVAHVNSSIDDSLDDLVVSLNSDLTASNTAMYVPCYASTSADTIGIEINGWTNGTSTYIKVYTPYSLNEVGESQRHNGKWDDSKYRIEAYDRDSISTEGGYIILDGLQINNTEDRQSGNGIYDYANAPGIAVYKNNIIKKSTIYADSDGINCENTYAGMVYKAWNNIIYNFTRSGIRAFTNGSVYAYNNTVFNCGTGIENNASALFNAANNTVFSNTDDFDGTFATLDYNASDDLDGTNAIDISPQANEADGWNMAFVDYVNGDFRIKSIFSPLYDSGTAVSDVTADIINVARPQNNTHDIGAFEYTGGTAPKYKLTPGGVMKMKGYIKFK